MTSAETPSRCQAHCGTVPTLDPVPFEPESGAAETLESVLIETIKPNPAIGAATSATARFALRENIKFLSW